MTFVSINNFNGKNFIGQKIEIPYGTEVEVIDDFLYFEGIPFCAQTSELARRYFTWNGDGNWELRSFCEFIIYRDGRTKTWEIDVPIYDASGNIIGYDKRTLVGRFTPEEKEYIKTYFPDFLESEEGMIFSNSFFIGSDIKRVQSLANYLSD